MFLEFISPAIVLCMCNEPPTTNTSTPVNTSQKTNKSSSVKKKNEDHKEIQKGEIINKEIQKGELKTYFRRKKKPLPTTTNSSPTINTISLVLMISYDHVADLDPYLPKGLVEEDGVRG